LGDIVLIAFSIGGRYLRFSRFTLRLASMNHEAQNQYGAAALKV
jgi:hypothetical protein